MPDGPRALSSRAAARLGSDGSILQNCLPVGSGGDGGSQTHVDTPGREGERPSGRAGMKEEAGTEGRQGDLRDMDGGQAQGRGEAGWSRRDTGSP